MRTPNCKCIICGKDLYRRPYELAKTRYMACYMHRADAQRLYAPTEAQLMGLRLGRSTKGNNHLTGLPKSEESKRKCSASHKQYWHEHPDELQARGMKTRGEKHYRWNGGCTKLNISIRLMSENRKWMDSVKARDKVCTKCGGNENLESHHIKPLSAIIRALDIQNREEARVHKNVLWDLDNGITLCQKCHYREHGRTYED